MRIPPLHISSHTYDPLHAVCPLEGQELPPARRIVQCTSKTRISALVVSCCGTATKYRWSASSKPMATFFLHLVTGQLAMSSRLSRSTTSTWFLALLLIYIFGLDFSSAIASSVSPSILMSANFLPAVVSTTLSIEYVWWTSPPPLSM